MEFLTDRDHDTIREQRLCAGVPARVFFATEVGPRRPELKEQIERCYECNARELCLLSSLEYSDTVGIWGGLGERGRRQIRSEAWALTSPDLSYSDAIRKVVHIKCTSQ